MVGIGKSPENTVSMPNQLGVASILTPVTA